MSDIKLIQRIQETAKALAKARVENNEELIEQLDDELYELEDQLEKLEDEEYDERHGHEWY